MKLFVTAKPGSRVQKIEKVDEEHYVVAVKERAEDGKANGAIVKALAEYLNLKPYQIEILSGHTSRRKIFVIDR